MSLNGEQASNVIGILFVITILYFFVMVIGSFFGVDLTPVCLFQKICFGG